MDFKKKKKKKGFSFLYSEIALHAIIQVSMGGLPFG